MKKIKALGILGLMALTVMSCRRDYVCECEIQSPSGSTLRTLDMPNTSKNAADFSCQEFRATIKETNKICRVRR
jgi:hypothetical protein